MRAALDLDRKPTTFAIIRPVRTLSDLLDTIDALLNPTTYENAS